MSRRLNYADALMMIGGGGPPRRPETARDDIANARAGTPNGGTPEDMASRLMMAAVPSTAQQSADVGVQRRGISDGGRRGAADPGLEQPPAGVPSDARRQGDPMAQARAALVEELGPGAGEAAFRMLLEHTQG